MNVEADGAENPTPCDCQDVCNLPPEQFRDRKAMLARELLPHVMRRRRLEHGWALDFADTPALKKTLEDLVAFERACCSSLAWSLDRPEANVLRLRIEGLSPDHDFFNILGEHTEAQ